VGQRAAAPLPVRASPRLLVAIFVLAGNTLLRPLVDAVNRRPINPGETEALYRVHVVCPAATSAARDLLSEVLGMHHYPIREIETLSRDAQVELAAILVPTTANRRQTR
jgi:putative Mg2+ transporter-C (MgtC) family protein